ncbi:MAG: FAD-dependent thymidylate synthase [archaeon]
MKQVSPKVYLIGYPAVNLLDIDNFLRDIGTEWRPDITRQCDGEELVEIYGRLCYRSYDENLNPNITKVRKDKRDYFNNILKSGHGSVLEHSVFNFIFHNVSRIFTHELVRHRVGVAISQESLRFVRLNKLSAYVPKCIEENEEAKKLFEETFELSEITQEKLAELFNIDDLNFKQKKELTSAFRRMAPDGLSTSIGWSANIRTLRHTIQLRTHPQAEEEIRIVFNMVYQKIKNLIPNLLQDAIIDTEEGSNEIPYIKFEH